MIALAFDLGTTTLAASLIDTGTGRRLAMAGSLNPQRRFGADVVSRLDAAVHSEDALHEMSMLVRNELHRLAQILCEQACVNMGEIRQAAIAGNPAMQHILLGVPVKSLAFPPYRPLHTEGTRLSAADLRWTGSADIYVFPMPGGFVGGDTVAFIYGTGVRGLGSGKSLDQFLTPAPPSLFLDMGTNGEIALFADKTIWATSAAAGPAFEGGNLSCGMAALPGAINSVRVVDDKVKLEIIGSKIPAGICGSGAIEAVTELLFHNVLESGGRLRGSVEIPSNLAVRLIDCDGENAFVLHRDARHLLLITQGDIRQIQLAKGAIRAGMEVLAERSRIRLETLKEVVLTGSFGAVLRPEWLKNIGIFEESMVQNTRFVSEGALSGVERALGTGDGFESVEQLARCFKVVPLSGTPLFESLFIRHIDFPHY